MCSSDLVLLILFAAPVFLECVLGALILGGAWEWSALAGLTTPLHRRVFVAAMAGSMALAALMAGPGSAALAPLLLASGIGWIAAGAAVLAYPRGTAVWGSVPGRLLLGLFVLIPPWAALLYLRSLPHGEWLLLFCIVLIAFVDIGAFFAGRSIGGPKLMPTVSPAKTWSGFCGGLLCSMMLAVAVAAGTGVAAQRFWLWMFVCFSTALAAVVGDLLESMLKRYSGIKDSGSLLPGHGGLFDRLDSLTAGLPVFALGTLLAGGFSA